MLGQDTVQGELVDGEERREELQMGHKAASGVSDGFMVHTSVTAHHIIPIMHSFFSISYTALKL